jgi:hypothetical protein
MRPIHSVPAHLVVLLALAACDTRGAAREDADTGTPRTELVATSLLGDGAGCRAEETVAEGETSVLRCTGMGGYDLVLTESEGRTALSVVDPLGVHRPLDAAGAAGHEGLSRFTDRAEWQTEWRRGEPVPTALIVTYVAVRPSGPRNSAGERLDVLVAKLGEEVCITDRLPSITGARDEARSLAETAHTRPCLADDA